MNTHKIFYSAIIFLVLITFNACNTKKNNANEEQQVQHEEQKSETAIVQLDQHKIFHVGIKVEPVEIKSVAIPLTLPGKLELNERNIATISARISGRIEHVKVFINDDVIKNEVVAELYSQEFLAMQTEFLQAFERWKQFQQSNASGNPTAKSIYESAKKKLLVVGLNEQDISELERMQIPKTFLEIHSPINGTILESKIHAGDFVEMGKELFQLADLSTMWVLVNIYEKDLPHVKEKMKATVNVNAINESFEGIITSIYKVLDEQTRTVKARIELENKNGKLKSEMFCTVNIQTQLGKETIKIPASALLGETEKHFVFIALNDTTFEKRDVRTGVETRDFSEILDGILEGEKIVVKGGFFLKSELAKETFAEGE